MEASERPLKRLADAVGYANVDAFRRALARRVGIAPADYHRRFAR